MQNFYTRRVTRKYKISPCVYCGGAHTWHKTKHRLYCRDCKKYFYLSHGINYRNEGNAAWRALSSDNGHYTEEWSDIDTPQQRADLLRAIDALEGTAYAVLPHAKRPHCAECKNSVDKRDSWHNNGRMIHERCEKQVERHNASNP